jgi:preprotein translocase subunit SecG
METVVLVIHLLIALALIGVVLVQKSEGGGLGIGGGGGTMGGMMSARGTANLLTRTTAVLAGLFMLTSIVLALMAGGHSQPRSLIDRIQTTPAAPAPDAPPAKPAEPPAPAAPISK